jgi:hypothetical protein
MSSVPNGTTPKSASELEIDFIDHGSQVEKILRYDLIELVSVERPAELD